MQAYGHAKLPRLFHGQKEQSLIHQRDPVICKARCPRIRQRFHICQLFSSQPPADRSRLQHMNIRPFPLFLHILKRRQIVHRRLCIGHTDHRCKTAPCRCPGSGQDIFLISKARIPKMHMSIYKPRRHHKPRSVDHLCFRRLDSLSCLHNYRTIQQHIHHLICPRYRVHNPSILYQYHLHRSCSGRLLPPSCMLIPPSYMVPRKCASMFRGESLLWHISFSHDIMSAEMISHYFLKHTEKE